MPKIYRGLQLHVVLRKRWANVDGSLNVRVPFSRLAVLVGVYFSEGSMETDGNWEISSVIVLFEEGGISIGSG